MNIVYEKKTDKKLNEAIEALTEQLKENEFGVLWQLNFKDKLNEKGLDFENNYVVLEVCNPKKAKEVLQKNSHVGYVLPCKMVVREESDQTYIGMTRPEALIGLYDEPSLTDMAKEVEKTLKGSLDLAL
ncbi:DUF302 domain-containing protein [Alkalibacterium kapii]|uniref:DUF302 domain-containing protein n=1 Tax=Alkalibacterium kapii TaxID=426704 RepID=A0A511AXX4_9LACT|nr:DUF302 domain-containing protein [Alkalibacterium kapii]GEK92173.1 hypothetical protein AKA01nite_17950 [Alkalibacterium kapii]